MKRKGNPVEEWVHLINGKLLVVTNSLIVDYEISAETLLDLKFDAKVIRALSAFGSAPSYLINDQEDFCQKWDDGQRFFISRKGALKPIWFPGSPRDLAGRKSVERRPCSQEPTAIQKGRKPRKNIERRRRFFTDRRLMDWPLQKDQVASEQPRAERSRVMGDAAIQMFGQGTSLSVFRQAQNTVDAEYRPSQNRYLIGNKPEEQTFGADVSTPPGPKYRSRNLFRLRKSRDLSGRRS